MRRLLLVHYFYDVEFFIPLLQHLRTLLYSVETFGLFAARDAGPGYFRELMDRTREHDIVFFWTNVLSRNQMKCLRLCFPRKLFVRYTWYAIEPYNHMEREYFDLFFSSTQGFGLYLPPGVDTQHFRPRPSVEKNADVAVYAHTIFPQRERALEALRHSGLRVALFGGPAVGEMYPDLYRGEVPYDALPDSIAAARINLVLNHSPHTCITDSFFKALACGALVLTNVNKAPFYGKCAIVEADIVGQVRRLLAEDNSDLQQRARVISRQYDWSRFVERIHIKIAEKLFDSAFYASTFEHSFPPDALPDAIFEYWRFYGLPQLEVPFSFEIPPDDRPRIAHLRRESLFANKSDHYLCWHLRAGSQDPQLHADEAAEIPPHIHNSLQAIFHGAALSSLRTDPHINSHVQAFFQ